jgi:hypothetical protein
MIRAVNSGQATYACSAYDLSFCLTAETQRTQRKSNEINLCALCVSAVKMKEFNLIEHSSKTAGRIRSCRFGVRTIAPAHWDLQRVGTTS